MHRIILLTAILAASVLAFAPPARAARKPSPTTIQPNIPTPTFPG